MDLYEALKAGTSADELLAAFYKDLDAANERIAAEEAAEKAAAKKQKEYEERLSIARADAAEFLTYYFDTLFEDDDEISLSEKEIEDLLIELEESAKNILAFIKVFDTGDDKVKAAAPKQEKKEKPSIKVKYSTDDDIIKEFLKNLK